MLKKKKIIQEKQFLTPPARIILRIGFPLVIGQGTALLLCGWQSMAIDPFYTYRYYAPIMEYLLMSLTLLIGGAVLFDWLGAKRRG